VTKSLTIRSYAKLNYTLDVLSPRPDGYHGIASVMQCVSLADDITLSQRDAPGVEIACSAPGVPADSTNLAVRAAEAALAAAGYRDGLRIELVKRVPAQAGLGGGSSNAAYTLIGTNALLSLDLSDDHLATLAAALGSDVPFFLTGGTAVARGRGEQLTPLPDAPLFWFVIVKPDVSISTPWAYRALDEVPDRQSTRATGRMQQLIEAGDAQGIVASLANDFERVVLTEHLPVALLCDDLTMARARNARLCGSGSAVFGIAASRDEAEAVAAVMRPENPGGHVCRALTRAESLQIRSDVEIAR
jgi:4-diphosphocytidyl-2-C-methyl-D-erythritol kinase